jgi:branched-chain amino acid transport system ATP-binding protein
VNTLELSHVTVAYSGLTAISDVSVNVARGSIHAVLGPNGAGKTTLFNAITGYSRPASGRIVLDGIDISGLAPHRIAQHGVRRTFQNGGTFPTMTVLANVLTGLHQAISSSIVGSMFRLPSSMRAEREARDKAMDALARFNLVTLAERRVAALSFGERRMVEIVRALVSGAKLLMLDEPAVGLSVTERNELGAFLQGLAKNETTILIVEHVIDLVMSISDRITVLHHGEKIAEGSPQEIRSNERVLEVYLGE